MWSKRRFLLLATAIFLIGLVGSFMTYKTAPAAETVSKTISDQTFSGIELETNDADISIIGTEEQEARVEVTGHNVEEKFSTEVVDDVLWIEHKEKFRKFYNFGFKRLTVKVDLYLPEEQYESIKVKANNGKIRATNLKADKMSYEASNGKLHVENSEANELDVKTNNGQIIAEEIEGELVTLKADNGEIKYNHTEAQSSNIVTNNGKISINKVTGDITARADNGAIFYTTDSLAASLDFVTDNGKIKITTKQEPEDAEIIAQVDNGLLSIFGEKTGHAIYGAGTHRINLQADNGQITVEK